MRRLFILALIMFIFTSNYASAMTNEEAINIVQTEKIMTGTDNGFESDKSLTRAEMTTIIVRMKDIAENVTGDFNFEDVSKNHWAYNQINSAIRNNIVRGVGENKFMPDLNISINETVTMLLRAVADVEDIDEEKWPESYMECAEKIGILEGINKNGEEIINRAETARIIANIVTSPKWDNTLINNDFVDEKVNQGYGIILKVDGNKDDYSDIQLATPYAIVSYKVNDKELVAGTLIPGTYIQYSITQDKIWDVEAEKLTNLKEDEKIYRIVSFGDGFIKMIAKSNQERKVYKNDSIIYLVAEGTTWEEIDNEKTGVRTFSGLNFGNKKDIVLAENEEIKYGDSNSTEVFAYTLGEGEEEKVTAIIYVKIKK